jgi:hypothetical protein
MYMHFLDCKIPEEKAEQDFLGAPGVGWDVLFYIIIFPNKLKIVEKNKKIKNNLKKSK